MVDIKRFDIVTKLISENVLYATLNKIIAQ